MRQKKQSEMLSTKIQDINLLGGGNGNLSEKSEENHYITSKRFVNNPEYLIWFYIKEDNFSQDQNVKQRND